MTAIIHLTADAEPLALHGVADAGGTQIFGVHLALQILNAANEAEGRDYTTDFLDGLPSGKFHLLEIDEASGVVADTTAAVQTITPVKSRTSGDVMAWLDRAKEGFAELESERIKAAGRTAARAAGDRPFFSRADGGGEVSFTSASAFDLLRATAKWPAPLAQHHGLMRAVQFDHPFVKDRRYALVWVQEGETLGDVSAVVDAKKVTVRLMQTVGADGDGNAITREQITDLLAPYDHDNDANKGLGLQPDGKFDLTANSEGRARLLTRIEEEAPTLLWPATTLGSMALDPEFVSGFMADRNALTDKTELPRVILDWAMKASVVSLFDITISGLLLPVLNDVPAGGDPVIRRQSTVLQRLSRRIVADFDTRAEADGQISPVDEPKVYQALHVALWAGLTSVSASDLSSHLTALLPETELAIVLAAMAATTPAGDGETITWRGWRALLQGFAGELGDLALALEGEEGAESWMLARFAEAFHGGDVVLGKVDFSGTGVEGVVPDSDTRARIFASLYADFVADITGPFDAAEAIRRDFGADVVAAVQPLANPTAELPQRGLFSVRFPAAGNPPPQDAFDTLFRLCIALERPAATATPQDPGQVLQDGLIRFGRQRLQELVAETEATALFRPDAAPQPLRIPLLDTADPDTLDKLAGRISGLGFLVAGSFEETAFTGNTVVPDHVCLIGVKGFEVDGVGADGVKVDPFVTVEPVMPAPIPGTNGLFLPYEGQPISSPSRATPGNGGAPSTTREKEALKKTQAYTRTEAEVDETPTLPGQTSITAPELSYGAFYAAAGFWVPPSGVLPTFFREPATTPPANEGAFVPKNPVAGELTLTPHVRYQRRTAIAETTVRDPVASRPLARGLHPLSLDDPRLVVERQSDALRHLDLYRRADGTGALEPGDYLLYLKPEGEAPANTPAPDKTTVLTLSGVDLGGLGRADLTVAIDTSVGDATDAILDLAGTGFAFSVASGTTAWLRLRLPPAADHGAIAFDDPAHEMGQDSAGRSGSLIVLAPEKDGWREPHSRDVQFEMPRVSFPDLERWASNTALWSATTGLATDDAAELLNDLRLAHALYEALPGTVARAYADKLNALPDPAVTGLYLGAAIADGVNRSDIDTGVRSAGTFVPLSPYAGIGRFRFPAFVEDSDQPKPDDWIAAMKPVGDAIDAILEAGRVAVKIAGSATADTMMLSGSGDLTVPAGQIARLWATPAVKSSLIDAPAAHADADALRLSGIFDERMADLSCGTFADSGGEVFTLFDGAKLVVEVMDTPKAEFFADSPIAAQAAGAARGYAVLSVLNASQRIYSEAVLTTQRWRPTGRPIYTYITPAPDGTTDGPVIVLDKAPPRWPDTPHNADAGDIAAFEDEAFVGRQATDGEVTKVRLLPAPDPTVLWQFDWPENSATYLRHSAVFRSRYAAAMERGASTTETNATENKQDRKPFVLRVAILADAAAAAPTRPQLRAHLPLQRRVDDETLRRVDDETLTPPIAWTPPIACILHEPPHAQLGLADRLAADLIYTNVFDLKPDLELDELRKEVGPDPLLSWFPIDGDTSKRCRIDVEGPVGLHYEGPSTLAPAFPNSQYLLQPVTDAQVDKVQMAELEESFAGISLSRFSDPAWVWQRPVGASGQPTMAGESWIALERAFELRSGAETILSRRVDGPVEALRTALYEKGGDGEVIVTDAEVDALLLKPLDAERLRVSLFRTPEPGELPPGRSNRPYLVASLILRVRGDLVFNGGSAIRAVRQSEATFARWVKTSRDMGQLIAVTDTTEIPVRVKDLVARWTGTQVQLADPGTAVTSPVSRRRYPLHVHRRLVHLLRKPATQLGAPVALFHRALLTDGTGRSEVTGAETADSVQLAEMETRASIHLVQNRANVVGAEFDFYRTALFDLAGSRLASKSNRQLRFFVRAANARLALDGLKLDLTLLDGGGELLSKKVDLPAPPGATTEAQTLEIVLFTVDEDNDLHAAFQIDGGRFSNLETVNVAPSTARDLLATAETAQVLLENAANTECWTDISVLQGVTRFSLADPHAFDFDWVFSDGGAELPDALDPLTLNSLPEAQARFVGMTRPIPLRDSP